MIKTSLKPPKVTVVLTTHMRAHILAETIESILGQTFSDFELLVCDDCSPDETESVCRKYEKIDRRVRYYRGEKNVGMPANLNAGIQATGGQYVANLHDGDVYDPTLLEKWAAALDECPNAAFVFNAYRQVNAAGTTLKIWREPLAPCVRGHVLLEQIYFRRWMFDSPVWGTVMARRSAYLGAGLFDPRFGYVADVDMWLRLAEEYDVAYIAEPLIGLPTIDALPKSWKGVVEAGRIPGQIERMFWEARVRHYRADRGRLLLEMLRHTSFVARSRAFRFACRVKARLLRRGNGNVSPQAA